MINTLFIIFESICTKPTFLNYHINDISAIFKFYNINYHHYVDEIHKHDLHKLN